jgi:phage-related minor tail protein
MSGQVKGITIQFRGDTTSLDKALRKVKTDSKDIDSQLKKVNNALKFNPKNVELLTQKQGLLREKVTQTQKSLEDLRKIQSQMDASGVSKQSAEYQQVRREIIETESKLKHFQAEAQKLANVKLTAFKAQLDEMSNKFKTAGDSLTKYVTLPLAALGSASAVAFNGVQDSLNIVTKLTGASGKDLVDMQNIVKDMATRVPADFDTIATAVGEVNTRFGLTGDQLDKVSEQFVKFSQINGIDVTQAVDTVQKSMSNFGLSADDTANVLDVLTKVSQNTGVSIDRLTNGLISNGTAFQEMGLDINQSATLMGMLEKSGVNMETATNGMRKALKNATADGKDMNTALIELQEAILNDTDGTKGLQAAYDLFGKSGDQVYGAIKAGTLDFEALADASTDASGALDGTFDQTITPAMKFQTVLNRLKLLGYDIANSVLPVIEPLIQKIADGIGKITQKWNKLPKNTQQRIVAVAAALAAVGPALVLVSKGISLVSKGISAAQAVVGGFSKALTFLAANPIVAIIAGIAALVAAFVILWNKSEAFRNFFINLWNGIRTTVTTIWNGITSIFTNAWYRITSIWNGVGAFFSGKWQQIKNVFAGVVGWFGSVFANAWSAIKSKFASWGSFWSGLWTAVKNKFSSIGSAVGSAISGAVKRGVNAVIGKVESVINGAISLINGAIALADKIVPGKLGRVKKVYLPRLAEGGIVNSATVAMIGEGSSSEAVIPLDELWKRLDKMTASIAGSGDGSPVVVNVYGAAGQNVNELAAAVAARLTALEKQKARAWA